MARVRRRDALRIALLSAACALATAPAADGAVTIGSSLGVVPNASRDGSMAGYTALPTAIPGRAVTAPSSGVITRWRVRAGTAVTPVQLHVLRPSGMALQEVARSAEATPDAGTTTTFSTRISIQVGDSIALECCAGPGDFFVTSANATTDLWSPPIGDDETAPMPTEPAAMLETAINADIEPDADGDGFGDESQDNCRGVANPGQENSDGDGLGNACDNCPSVANPGQQNLDRDAQGDACDADDDNDGDNDGGDNCPRVFNPGQENLDRDASGDACDGDRDGDGRPNGADNCPSASNAGQQDLDRDRVGDACDPDRDGDGLPNGSDVCPGARGFPPRGCPTPPIVRFKAPLAGTGIGPTARIELEVADDRGSPVVSVFDDDGTVCVLRAAPYACTWQPTGADVGRATLVASAVDSDRNNSLAVVRVRVNRFEARLTRKVRRRGSRIKVTGRLVLPDAVEPELGCTGDVTVRLRRVKRSDDLNRRCRYSVRLPNRRGKVRASFRGNEVIAPT